MTEAAIRRRFSGRTVLAAIAMMIGVVAMAYGYYEGNNLFLYGGLILTLGGVLTETVHLLFLQSPMRP
jgi:drug/metabolite transporter (DMT)-like permease